MNVKKARVLRFAREIPARLVHIVARNMQTIKGSEVVAKRAVFHIHHLKQGKVHDTEEVW